MAKRQKFAAKADDLAGLLSEIQNVGLQVDGPSAGVKLPDDDDVIYLDAALAAGADAILTGNLKHFPDQPYGAVRVLSVRDFAAELGIA